MRPGASADSERVRVWSEELRAVHDRLRSALVAAREAVDSGEESHALGGDLLLYCHGFCAALDGHHRSEDVGLFPQVAAARPDLAPVLAKLGQDHSLMSSLIRGLEHALASGAEPAVLHGHLDGLDAIMESHFGYEERSLLAVLDGITLTLDPRGALGEIAD